MNDTMRVVVTGLGAISPCGPDTRALHQGVMDCTSTTAPVRTVSIGELGRTLACEVPESAEAASGYAALAGLGRAARFGVIACREALADAGLADPPPGMLVALGSALGDVDELERIGKLQHAPGGDGRVSTLLVARHSPPALPTMLARALGLQGVRSLHVFNACASSAGAIALGFEEIRRGRVERALVGGYEAFSRIVFSAFVRLGAVAPERCQPFDLDRKGLMYGEGAGALVIESLASARRRGARIHAELTGYGLSCDANHMTAPHVRGMSAAIRSALRMAGIGPDQVDYFGAHGTATQANDLTEARAIHEVFGARARTLPVSSIKGVIGHSHGAANVHHVIATVLSMGEGRVPPTANHERMDPECALDCVPNRPREVTVRDALVNAAGFGGNNACLALRRWQ
ncbi:MAG: beta-ketoacyl-[acyl-carrier-protein] synthase family protein [Myxococcota bacterium]|nr:beta-ketoacyl-[acyl-carrier-protein] synthase family protein [Myxococcota bacterium]